MKLVSSASSKQSLLQNISTKINRGYGNGSSRNRLSGKGKFGKRQPVEKPVIEVGDSNDSGLGGDAGEFLVHWNSRASKHNGNMPSRIKNGRNGVRNIGCRGNDLALNEVAENSKLIARKKLKGNKNISFRKNAGNSTAFQQPSDKSIDKSLLGGVKCNGILVSENALQDEDEAVHASESIPIFPAVPERKGKLSAVSKACGLKLRNHDFVPSGKYQSRGKRLPPGTPPTLTSALSNVSRDFKTRLEILSQPEEQHRARYQTEGSRGAIKDRKGNGFPSVKLIGYDKPATLQIFIGTDQGKVNPHMFYQACKVTGKSSTPCMEKKIEGTVVIEIDFEPNKEMVINCDCVGILKERNVDVEQRFPFHHASQNRKKSTKCRLVFRTTIMNSCGVEETLQVSSLPILCTQPPGQPEICKQSLAECSVAGGEELFVIGKNFLKETYVNFEIVEDDGRILWEHSSDALKDYLQQSHLICVVPPFEDQNVSEPVECTIRVVSGGKKSEPQRFTYLPKLCRPAMAMGRTRPDRTGFMRKCRAASSAIRVVQVCQFRFDAFDPVHKIRILENSLLYDKNISSGCSDSDSNSGRRRNSSTDQVSSIAEQPPKPIAITEPNVSLHYASPTGRLISAATPESPVFPEQCSSVSSGYSHGNDIPFKGPEQLGRCSGISEETKQAVKGLECVLSEPGEKNHPNSSSLLSPPLVHPKELKFSVLDEELKNCAAFETNHNNVRSFEHPNMPSIYGQNTSSFRKPKVEQLSIAQSLGSCSNAVPGVPIELHFPSASVAAEFGSVGVKPQMHSDPTLNQSFAYQTASAEHHSACLPQHLLEEVAVSSFNDTAYLSGPNHCSSIASVPVTAVDSQPNPTMQGMMTLDNMQIPLSNQIDPALGVSTRTDHILQTTGILIKSEQQSSLSGQLPTAEEVLHTSLASSHLHPNNPAQVPTTMVTSNHNTCFPPEVISNGNPIPISTKAMNVQYPLGLMDGSVSMVETTVASSSPTLPSTPIHNAITQMSDNELMNYINPSCFEANAMI